MQASRNWSDGLSATPWWWQRAHQRKQDNRWSKMAQQRAKQWSSRWNPGVNKIMSKVRQWYYWLHVRKNVERWFQRCSTCTAGTRPQIQNRGTLQLVWGNGVLLVWVHFDVLLYSEIVLSWRPFGIGHMYKVLSESSQTRSKKKCWLNLLNFGCHLLQNSLFGNTYSDPIIFPMLQKHYGSHFP
jgi:hypothetical protein